MVFASGAPGNSSEEFGKRPCPFLTNRWLLKSEPRFEASSPAEVNRSNGNTTWSE
jgi:hypothetical protein